MSTSEDLEHSAFLFAINSSIIQRVVEILEELIEEDASKERCSSIFNNNAVPIISISAYLKRFADHANIKGVHLIAAVVYIDRIMESKDIWLTKLNIHKLFIK